MTILNDHNLFFNEDSLIYLLHVVLDISDMINGTTCLKPYIKTPHLSPTFKLQA